MLFRSLKRSRRFGLKLNSVNMRLRLIRDQSCAGWRLKHCILRNTCSVSKTMKSTSLALARHQLSSRSPTAAIWKAPISSKVPKKSVLTQRYLSTVSSWSSQLIVHALFISNLSRCKRSGIRNYLSPKGSKVKLTSTRSRITHSKEASSAL